MFPGKQSGSAAVASLPIPPPPPQPTPASRGRGSGTVALKLLRSTAVGQAAPSAPCTDTFKRDCTYRIIIYHLHLGVYHPKVAFTTPRHITTPVPVLRHRYYDTHIFTTPRHKCCPGLKAPRAAFSSARGCSRHKAPCIRYCPRIASRYTYSLTCCLHSPWFYIIYIFE